MGFIEGLSVNFHKDGGFVRGTGSDFYMKPSFIEEGLTD